MSSRTTIFALSSGGLPSGVAITRISGPGVRFALETMCGSVPPARKAALKSIRSRKGDLIDRGIVVFFPGPNSFTGEDCAEFQVHGGRATVSALLAELGFLPGFRQADAGEFTRRAFENGRMDLTAVEGLSDLIRAETELQRKQALLQSEGSLRALYQGWADRILRARALIEAELDFADEEDIPGAVSAQIWPDMESLAGEMRVFADRYRQAEIIRDGFRVVLVGPPNAGKSSLLNALARREAAIVSDEAGTTRDIVEVRMELGGTLVIVQDTAGIRETTSQIEQEGIRRSLEAVRNADLALLLVPANESVIPADPIAYSETERLVIQTKADLIVGNSSLQTDFRVSAMTGCGLPELIDEICRRAVEAGGKTNLLPARERHVQLIRTASELLCDAVCSFDGLEIRSEYLRGAAVQIGRITGTTDVEDLLGVIFSEFCVGK